MDVVRAAEAQSWRHARTLALPQCQGEEDPGRIAFLKSLPQRAPAGSARRFDWEKSLPQLHPPAASCVLTGRSHCRSSSPPAASCASTGRRPPPRLPPRGPSPCCAALRCPQRAPAGSVLRLDWEDHQYAGATKSAHAMAVAGLAKRQRIDNDQAKHIVDARPRCPCCE
ncbi:hypothetical protein T492DRAFT_120030 [Pavlovales sp. CCMP2436]|nr:hypothetical protein T492DRAFT_120030 [Pavlovales sp. CCMP2436]